MTKKKRVSEPAAATVRAVHPEPASEAIPAKLHRGSSGEQEAPPSRVSERDHLKAAAQEKRDSSPEKEKVENLRTLNRMLLKEQTEKRGEVAALKRRLSDLELDAGVLAEVERGVGRVAVAAIAADFDERSRRLEGVVDAMSAEAAAAAETARALKQKVELLQQQLHSATECALANASAKEKAERLYSEACKRTDSVSRDLEATEGKMKSAESRGRELEAMVAAMRSDLDQVRTERDELIKKAEAYEASIRVLQDEKQAVESALKEQRATVKRVNAEMEERMKTIEKELELANTEKAKVYTDLLAVKEKQSSLVILHGQLESEIQMLKDELELSRQKEASLRSNLEAKTLECVTASQTLEGLRAELSALERESKDFAAAAEAEKMKILKELELIRGTIKASEEKMNSMSAEKRAREAEIHSLTSETEKHRLAASELQTLADNLVKEKAELLSANAFIKEELNSLRAESISLKSRIAEVEKRNGEREAEAAQLKAALEDSEKKVQVLSSEMVVLHGRKSELEGRLATQNWLYPTITAILAALTFISAVKGR